MRTHAALVATLCAACTPAVLAEPRILVSPYLAVYQVRGEIGMQSQPVPAGPLQDNAPQPMRNFGQDHHREDVGVRADIGDGFAGFRIDYYRLDMNTGDNGTLTADWGRLLANDNVAMRIAMDELRVGYLEPLVHLRSTYRDRPLSVQIAAGGVFAYRSMDLRARTTDGARTQNADISGDVIYPAARFRAAWRGFAFDADYAISPELELSGDWEGVMQDIELRIAYTLPLHDITFFGGYRYSTLPAEGQSDGFAYDADLTIDGFQFGVSVTF